MSDCFMEKKSFYLSVVTPTRSIEVKNVASILFQTFDGKYAVLTGHEPYIISVKSGIIKSTLTDGTNRFIIVDSNNAILSINNIVDEDKVYNYVICAPKAYDLDLISVDEIKKINNKSLIDDLLKLKLHRLN